MSIAALTSLIPAACLGRRCLARRAVFITLYAGAAAASVSGQPTRDVAAVVPHAAAIASDADLATAREKLLRDLGGSLVSHFNVSGELQVEFVRPWTPSPGLTAQSKFEVTEYPPAVTSSMLVRGKFVSPEKPAVEATFLIRAVIWRDAWVARQPLSAGAVLDPANLDVRRVDVLRERDIVPAEQADSGYVLARQVAAGRLLTWRDIVRRPLVRKGEMVEVEAGEGMLLVTMKAVAMESGARGDTIQLRNPESRKNFSALVVHENRVQVRF